MGLTVLVPTVSELRETLREAGLRVTQPRVAVLTAVYERPHADTDSILAAAREDLGSVSHQTVYDVLRALTAARLVRRIEPPGSVARYESRVGDNHHHLVCRSCGEIVDVDCAVGVTPCLTASDYHGFEIDEAEVVYWGECPRCAAATVDTAVARDAAAHHQQVQPQSQTIERPLLGAAATRKKGPT
jgi:Fur family ferric uptake transcriptional regulator